FEVEKEITVGDSPNLQDDFRVADEYAAAYQDTIDEAPTRSQNWIESENERRNDIMQNIASPSETLQDHVIEQLSWFDLSDDLRNMVERIIYNLDPNGFLDGPVENILGPKAKATEKILAQKALDIIRKLDPPGVGASGIKECLLLQISPDMPYYELLKLLITDHLEDLEHNRLPAISKKTGFTISDIQEALVELRKLSPKPSAGFREQQAPPLIPDIIVDKDENGTYSIKIEEGNMPKLQISGYYQDLMKRHGTDKDTRDYIKQKVGSAQWLIDSIRQRRITLTKVAHAIIDHQYDFLEQGPKAIKPLKMQQIADKVGVHVTTVSRACDDKWMLSPQGLFPLKRFFTSSVQAADGEDDVSQESVKIKLVSLIEKEDKLKPLSDEELVKLLDDEGFKVARRTVVKYRQSMDIPSSRARKIWK
ncbi:MAG: RNA polymerase factor sigma-54, partial [Thermoguttaceae bacterium]